MNKRFDHRAIEQKWQEEWKKSGIYDAGPRDPSKEKKYILVEWPYPSGNLHVGHWFTFAVVDIYVRFLRMRGFQVLFPMGFDAFGLPAENAAIKRGLDPAEWTFSNIKTMRAQFESMGGAFSWDKSVSSTDPEYFQWTQWMFTKFFENDIAFRGKGVVNWCPSCNTVLANEQVLANDTCERCGTHVEKREMDEWKLRITKYADRLIDDLDGRTEWPEFIKDSQRNWIGRSRGATIPFALSNGVSLDVFTTRPDTLFGVTFLALAPEHPMLASFDLVNREEVMQYVDTAKQKDDIDRTNATKEKTGVRLGGLTARNPATGADIPVFVADYVLPGYGTACVMGVPAHDERDFAFAKRHNLPITQVLVTCGDDPKNPPQEGFEEVKRDTVIVHLRDRSTGKFAVLDWHGTLEGITTAIMGGIEEGQTPEDAALAEIKEEAALTDVRIVQKLPWVTGARYCASHKKQNRVAHSYAFLAEVESLVEQGDIDAGEQALHTLTWIEEKDMLRRLTPLHQKQIWELLHHDGPLLGSEGYLTNSGDFDGMDFEKAKEAIVVRFGGSMTNTYRIRDWSIGRQRYWGVPIPIVYDPEGNAHPIPREHLPWKLPTDVDFRPTGEAPLAKSKELRERVERIFGAGWTPEVETMDTFVDSSWYFLRYLDKDNMDAPVSLAAQKEWMPVDVYFGGSEHTTMHLLYSRFWQKVLFDLGLVNDSEPYVRRVNRGLVLGPDGQKMSKSKGNVVDPDEQVMRVGSDTVKMYLAFMGNYGEPANYPWDMGGIAGIRRFLERVNGLSEHVVAQEPAHMTRMLHKTIAKVSEDIEALKFNTAISALMMYVNAAEKEGLSQVSYEVFVTLIAPFAPHLAEALWADIGKTASVHRESFPTFDTALLQDDVVTIGVQVAGKRRGDITIAPNASEADALAAALADARVLAHLPNGTPSKVVYVPGRILNLVP